MALAVQSEFIKAMDAIEVTLPCGYSKTFFKNFMQK
jgi:hypothetical protein